MNSFIAIKYLIKKATLLGVVKYSSLSYLHITFFTALTTVLHLANHSLVKLVNMALICRTR
jgi:hypothetical protein